MANFYVYEHWRLDRNECFYVGKGSGDRAYSRRSRNAHWRNIVAKLERIGSAYEVRIIACDLIEEMAFVLEQERIALWKDTADLANKTTGGEGFSGGRHTKESKRRIGVGSVKTAAKYREAMSARMKGANNPFYGKKHSPEAIERIRQANIGRPKPPKKPLTDEQKAKISATLKAKGIKPPSRKGISPTMEARGKQAESLRAYWARKKENLS